MERDVIDGATILSVFQHAPLVARLETADLACLVTLAQRRSYRFGEWLFHEATPRHWFGIVERGMVELVRGPLGHAHHVGVLRPGDALAEGLFLDGLPHSVSAIAIADTTVVQVSAAEMVRLRAEHPSLYSRLAHDIAMTASDRMRARADQLARAGNADGERRAH